MVHVEAQLKMLRGRSSWGSLLTEDCKLSACIIIFILTILGLVTTALLTIQQCSATSKAGDLPEGEVVSNPLDMENSTEVTMPDHVSMPPTIKLTKKQRFHQQQEKLKGILKCQPMLLSVKMSDELGNWDKLRDKDLLPPVAPLTRCPSYCWWGGRCLPTKTTNATVVVRYKDVDNKIKYEDREFEEHLECSCR